MSTNTPPSAPTPGPWNIDYHVKNEYTIAINHTDSHRSKLIALCPTGDRANARLIAAAPELLHLAKGFSDACNDRIAALEEDDIYQCSCSHEDEESERWEDGHVKHCDTGQQIRHWKAYQRQIDAVIAKATGRS